MAIKGLSYPVCGNYTNTDGAVTYAEPFIADAAIEWGVSWTTSENNPLYANNAIKENDKGTFQSGELTLSTADMTQELSVKLLGTKTKQTQLGQAGGQLQVTEQIFDDSRSAPYFGYGIIEQHQIDDVDKYRAIFLHKVYFNIPEEAATTKGETVEWQTKSITGIIQRSDEVTEDRMHPWMTDAWFDTESEALTYLMYKCGKTTTEAAYTNTEEV